MFSFNFELLAYGHFAASDRNLDDALLARALDSPAMRDLVGLGVAGNRLGPASGRPIAAHPRTAGLRELQLGSNLGFGGEGRRALAGAPFLATIVYLDVSNIGADGYAFTALAGARRLEVLAASCNPLGDEAVPALLALPALEHLHLGATRISLGGLRALLAHPTLRLLDLDGTPLGSVVSATPGAAPATGPASLPATAPAPGAGPSLAPSPEPASPDLPVGTPWRTGGGRWTLALSDTGLTLGEIEWLFVPEARIGVLDVSGNPLGDAGADALAAAPWLATLNGLDADGIGASPEAVARLRAAWGDRPGLPVNR